MSCKKPTIDWTAEVSRRALLLPDAAAQALRITRYPVGEALSHWAQFHWIIEWDIPAGQTYSQSVMPYPNANLAFESGQSAIYGPCRKLFTRVLHGRGRIHGVRFKCGGLRPWISRPMSELSDRRDHPGPLLPEGIDLADVEAGLLGRQDHHDAVAEVERMLSARMPSVDPLVQQLDDAVAVVQADRSIIRTSTLQSLLGLDERALQRRFMDYLGVSPKWLIQRARIHDALQWFVTQPDTALAEIALSLGFFDQAHFSRRFRQQTGESPQQYRDKIIAQRS